MSRAYPKIVIVTNIPVPYRIPVYQLLSQSFDLHIIYCAKSEKNRLWKDFSLPFKHYFLKECIKAHNDGFNFTHNNPDVWKLLNTITPDVVVTTGFNPTHLYAFFWSKLHKAKHICMTDGTLNSESMLTFKHRIVRKLVFRGSQAFIAASLSGMQVYKGYGIAMKTIFQSHLCANNEIFFEYAKNGNRPYDVIFSGQLHEQKLPFLFVETCLFLKKNFNNLNCLVIGDGPLRESVLQKLSDANIPYEYPGFVTQTQLPHYYSQAKVLLFTTRGDTWGVVANEALAAGTPVVTTPQAGVAHELVIDGVTGFVRNADAEQLADAIRSILNSPTLWKKFSQEGLRVVSHYNYQAAAAGIQMACQAALAKGTA